MCFNDIEFLIIFLLTFILFISGLTKREVIVNDKYPGIDLPMSSALKGVACVFILMGHFVSRRTNIVDAPIVSKLVYLTTANIALAIFMFFSGYGLTLKKTVWGGRIYINRLKKVYLPLLYTCIIALILYTLLPSKFTLIESDELSVPKDIWFLHHFTIDYIGILASHVLGWKDWYVFCIMFFYSFFYLSGFLTRKNQTWVLWLMFIIYYVCAYFYFGPLEAHWYRYCWAFFLGHIYAKMVLTRQTRKLDMLMEGLLLSTILIESPFMILSYLIAVLVLCVSSRLNKRYVMNNRLLAFMGAISYFFYLSHERIGYTILAYTNIYSVLLWVLITIIISFALSYSYKVIKNK